MFVHWGIAQGHRSQALKAPYLLTQHLTAGYGLKRSQKKRLNLQRAIKILHEDKSRAVIILLIKCSLS